MLTKVYSMPARSIVRTIPAHTVIETAYEYEDLPERIREELAQAKCEALLGEDMKCEEDYYSSLFPNSILHLQWDASCRQGSGVNIHGVFSINDLLAKVGMQPIDEDFDIKFGPNHSYTYSKWCGSYYGDDIWQAVHDEYWWWEDVHDVTNDDPIIGGKTPYDIFIETWTIRIDAIVEHMDSICKDIHRFMDEMVFGGYENPDYYEDELFDEDGSFLCYRHEWED